MVPFAIHLDDIKLVIDGLKHPVFLGTIFVYLLSEIFPRCLVIFEIFLPNSSEKESSKKNSQNSSVTLSNRQSMIARWYLLNGLIIHFLLDGTSGVWQWWTIMGNEYLKLDKRFEEPLSGIGIMATMATQMELIVMFPLCMIAYYAYRCHVLNFNGKTAVYPPWVYVLEVMVACFQLCGTWFYNGTEVVHIILRTGVESVPVDWKLEFTLDYIVYFWFAFVFCPIIWVIVPIWMIKRASQDLTNAQMTYKKMK